MRCLVSRNSQAVNPVRPARHNRARRNGAGAAGPGTAGPSTTGLGTAGDKKKKGPSSRGTTTLGTTTPGTTTLTPGTAKPVIPPTPHPTPSTAVHTPPPPVVHQPTPPPPKPAPALVAKPVMPTPHAAPAASAACGAAAGQAEMHPAQPANERAPRPLFRRFVRVHRGLTGCRRESAFDHRACGARRRITRPDAGGVFGVATDPARVRDQGNARGGGAGLRTYRMRDRATCPSGQ